MSRRERFFELFSHGGAAAYAMSLMGQGYMRSARLTCAKSVRSHDDYLIFPAVFLYRHAVELALKSMIEAAREESWYSGRVIPERDPRKDEVHDLRALLGRANELLPASDQVPDLVAKVVDALAGIDPTSYEFRYTRKRTKKGQQITPTDAFDKPLSITGLRRIFNRRTINALFFFVDALLQSAETNAEMQAEVEAEMAADYRGDSFE